MRRADIDPKVVYISTLQRTRQTAEVLFPDAELVPVDGLKEMCFGSFEGRNYIEMEHDPDYQAWVAANCESSCPDGERKDDFSDRVCRTICGAGGQGAGRRRGNAGDPGPRRHPDGRVGALRRAARSYYRWCGPNAGGYVLDARDWAARHELRLVKTVQYTKESTC